MDVHPPHHPIQSWRDFLLHLVTITIGLCIALALEAGAEAVHHRQIVRAAYADLRREIEANHAQYADNVRRLQSNRERLRSDIDQLLEMRSGKKLASVKLGWSWAWDNFTDAAWQSARDLGAIPYMQTEALNRYTDVYAQQEIVNQAAIAITGDETVAGAALFITRDASKLLPSEMQDMLVATARIDLRLEALESMMRSLDQQYVNALK